MLIDLTLPDGSGIEVIRKARKIYQDLPCFVLSGRDTVEAAVEAIKAGAENYWVKPYKTESLLSALWNSVTVYQEKTNRPPEPSSALEDNQRWKSPLMCRATETARAAAATTATVLITGKESTGKGSFAQMIHHCGKMKGTPFHRINLAALSPAQIEKELFGAPLGNCFEAMSHGWGRLEKSRGGCLYLENIDCLHPAAQQHLMGLIDEKRGTTSGKAMCRLIVSSSVDFQQTIRSGAFRQDLWYALSVYHVEIPCLLDRPEDIPLLCESIITQICVTKKLRRPTLTRKALEQIQDHTWPGNLSELYNAIEHAISSTCDGLIAPVDLPPLSRDPLGESHSMIPSGASSIEEITKITLVAALEACNGNRRRAAARLKVSLRTIYNMIERYDLKATTNRVPSPRGPLSAPACRTAAR